MKVKDLWALVDEDDAEELDKIHALYEGGEDWREMLNVWLPAVALEPPDVTKERHARATYDNHMQVITNLALGSLFADPPYLEGLPDDVWNRLAANCDRMGTSWASFYRARMRDAMLYRRAWTWVELAGADAPVASAAEEEQVTKGGVYLREIDPRSVVRFTRSTTGALASVLISECLDEPGDIIAPPVKVHRWTAVDSLRIRRWEWRSTPDRKDPREDDEVSALPEVLHNYGVMPIVLHELDHDLWMGARLLDPATALTRASNELEWSVSRSAHEMLVIYSRADMKTPKVGVLQYLQAYTHENGPSDKVEYVGPSGTSLKIQIERERDRRTELYRAAQMLHIAANPTAAGALQSAEAKARDMEATALLLESYTDGLIDYMGKCGRVIATVINKPIDTVKACGLRGEEDKNPTAWLEAAALAPEIVEASPTAAAMLVMKKASVLLDDMDEETRDLVESEISAFYAARPPMTPEPPIVPDPTPPGAGDDPA